MKPRIPAVLLFTIAALLLGAAPLRQDRDAEFLDKFKQALELGAEDEMKRLVAAYEEEAVHRIVYTCEQISEQPTDELETLMAGLRGAWEASHASRFAEWAYEYFSLLDPAVKREQQRLRGGYDACLTRFAAAEKSKNAAELESLAGELSSLANGFTEIGNDFHASQCWVVYARCVDQRLRGDKADFKKAAEALGRGIDLRRKIGLEDRHFKEMTVRRDELIAAGWGDAPPPVEDGSGGEAKPAEPAPPPEPAAAGAAPLVVPMTFARIDAIDAFQRPTYVADDAYSTWNALNLSGKGSITRFGFPGAPDVVRVGAADVRVDRNRNGSVEDDAKIPLTGKMTPVEFPIGKGDEERPWAFLTVTGVEEDVYQNIKFNLQPNDDYLALYTVSAASMVGQIGGTQVRVIDDNMDGIYGSLTLPILYIGLSKDVAQPDLDAIVVGDAKRAVPWSEYLQVGTQWYRLESKRGGLELKATPMTVPTGTLKLDYSGPAPAWLVVRGAAPYENAFFDLAGAGAKGGVSVPAGRYTLCYGELRAGKKQQAMKCVILPSGNTPVWQVAAGGTTTVPLGEPYRFDFQTKREGSTVTVVGRSVVVLGKSNERYERVWNAVPRPEVSWRKAGAKRGSKPEKMGMIGDQVSMADLGGWPALWAPLDLALATSGLAAGEEVEVQLVQKKNPLFGRVESDWKK